MNPYVGGVSVDADVDGVVVVVDVVHRWLGGVSVGAVALNKE